MDKFDPTKRCPLSFGFALRRELPALSLDRRPGIEIAVGFPCIGVNCAWYNTEAQECVIFTLAKKECPWKPEEAPIP